MAAVGFLSHYLSGPLPYARRHITVNRNVLCLSLNKTLPSFFPSLFAKINVKVNKGRFIYLFNYLFIYLFIY